MIDKVIFNRQYLEIVGVRVWERSGEHKLSEELKQRDEET